MNASVGPFSDLPPINGLTATIGASAASSASRMPGTARIGPMLATGLDGPITISSAISIARPTSSVIGGVVGAAKLDPFERRLGVLEDQVLLEVPPLALRLHVGLDGLVAHRQDERVEPERGRDLARDAGQPVALVQQRRSQQAGGEILVAELEPVGRADPDQLLEGVVRVVADSVAALLVDHVGEPVGDQVGVGGDVQAECGDVVAGVGDHRQLVRLERVGEPARQLGAAGAAGQQRDHCASGRGPAGR